MVSLEVLTTGSKYPDWTLRCEIQVWVVARAHWLWVGPEVSKDFKAPITNMFKELKETMMIAIQYIVSLNKAVEIINKNQMGHSLMAWSEEVNTSSLRNYKSGKKTCQNIYNINFLKLRNPLFKQKNTWNSPGKQMEQMENTWERSRLTTLDCAPGPDLLPSLIGLQLPLENHGVPVNWHHGVNSGSQGL